MPFLLERLSTRPLGLDRRPEAFDEEAAILAQIQRIMSTWRHLGERIARVPWGIQAVVDIGRGDTVQLAHHAAMLAQAIARYEPRLRHVRVKVEANDDPQSLHTLVLTAVFPGEDQPRTLRVAVPD